MKAAITEKQLRDAVLDAHVVIERLMCLQSRIGAVGSGFGELCNVFELSWDDPHFEDTCKRMLRISRLAARIRKSSE